MKITIKSASFAMLLAILSGGAYAQGSHSGPVAGGQHGSVLNAHSSDGNTSAAAHAGQQAIVSSDGVRVDGDDVEMIALAAMPSFSMRGDCGGPEGSVQAGGLGAFFGASWGDASEHDCHVRHNLAVISELWAVGIIKKVEARMMAREALTSLRGLDGLEYVTYVQDGVTITRLQRKPGVDRHVHTSVLERRAAE